MKMTETIRGMDTPARVAASAAPYVRRALSGEELHDVLRSAAETANDLLGRVPGERVREAFSDRQVRDDIGAVADALQHAAQRAVERPRRGFGRTLFTVTGVVTVVGAGVFAAAVAYPPTRGRIGRCFRWASERLSDTVEDARATATDFTGAAKRSVSDAASDLGEKAGEAADKVSAKAGDTVDELRGKTIEAADELHEK